MAAFDEKEMALLAEVLPNIAAQMRSNMANIYASASRIATPTARENDPKLDQNAALLTMSSYQLLRLTGNLSEVGELLKTSRYSLQNDDIIGFCRKMCEKVEPLFELKGISLAFSADRASHVIAMNSDKIERLLLNLLSNALKFTPSGGTTTVRVKVTERFVKLAVSDTGCGIEKERLETIFEGFLDTERLEVFPHGLGLGLPICRRIAQGHGGTIVAESVPGEGATFTVSLPNTKGRDLDLHDVHFDYAGGFNHVLVELSDALGPEAFYQRFLD